MYLERSLPDHGFLAEARRLAGLAAWRAGDRTAARRQFDELARIVRQSLDMRQVYRIALGKDHV